MSAVAGFGLSDKQYADIALTIASFPQVERVVVFGSRAMGNYKSHSDFDFLVIGARASAEVVSRLGGVLNEESPVPFKFDVLCDNGPIAPELREHVERYGTEFYPSPRDTPTFPSVRKSGR